MFKLNNMMMSGRESLPLVEGGKGINVSTGISAGAWAAADGVGTFSGVNADFYDENGKFIKCFYRGKTRSERQVELIDFGIKGAIAQARIAHDVSQGRGRIHMNVLWEMGGCEKILIGALNATKGLIDGITCGAGMPYRMAEIAAAYKIWYYPIVSSGRAFNALWKRAYNKSAEWLGGVVYEDPWLAGGHNGLSNSEDPLSPEAPLERVIELRRTMRKISTPEVPIIMAGGVWDLKEWTDWIDNPDLGPIAFQFGTRPLLTKESPISDAWKQRLLTLKPGDVLLHHFSPTGFYSSAVKNKFLLNLVGRSERQITYARAATDVLNTPLPIGARGRPIYLHQEDFPRAKKWIEDGFSEALRTPDSTVVFVTPTDSEKILRYQAECIGCLSQCGFSNWSQYSEDKTNGKSADPRSFCIQKSLQAIGHGGDVEELLMFAGHNVYRFSQDPFYANGFIPTVSELIERICTGE